MAEVFGTSWTEITAALGANEGLEFLQLEVADLSMLSAETLAGWSEAVLYQGFDVVRTIRLMKKRYDEYTRDHAGDATIEVTFPYNDKDGSPKTFKYTNKERILKDVALILFLFSNRGASWDKIKNKSREEFQRIMDFLKEKYDINTDVRPAGVSLKADEIIVSRIAACFPLKVVEFFHAGLAKELFPLSKLGLMDVSKGVLSNHFVGVIPRDLSEEDHATYCTWLF